MKIALLIFVGGAFGSLCREFLMLATPKIADGFPLDIFVANIIAAFLLGLVTSLFNRKMISKNINFLLATGVMGGLSTFSSFIFGAQQIMMEPSKMVVAIVYLVISVVVGFIVVELGMKFGAKVKALD